MLKFCTARFKLVAFSVASLLTLALLLSIFPAPQAEASSQIALAAQGKLSPAVLNLGNGQTKRLPFYANSTLRAAASALNSDKEFGFDFDKGEAADENSNADPGSTIGVDNSVGCSKRNSFNDGSVRVNQDCTFRRQAEELIKVNPNNPNNLIAGQNDSRIGYNHCGFDYSFDGGQTWGDGIPPYWQHTNGPKAPHTIEGGPGTGHTYDAASDPALAFDSRGNAYYSCITFDINTNASGLFVNLSPNPAGGSYYNNVPDNNTKYVVVEDNSPAVFHDKNFITADSFKNSPFRDRVYVTWTLFRQDCPGFYCSSTIYFAYSSDNSQTWSKPIEISGNNPDICIAGDAFDPRRKPGDCDFNQGSDPVVLPDGTIVVTFNNGNTPTSVNQQLAVRSTDGGVTWSKPVRVGSDVETNQTTCDFGRGPEACIQGPFIRTNDFPRIAGGKTKQDKGNVYVVWQDYRNGEFDVILSVSTDGGQTWKEASKPVNRSKGYDHYMPAVDIGSDGTVAVSYYRSAKPKNDGQIGTLGQEYFLAGGKALATPFIQKRIAAKTPSPDGSQAGFNGDYSGLVVTDLTAHPVWSDTRNKVPGVVGPQGVTHDEDIFTKAVPIPGSSDDKNRSDDGSDD